MADDALAQVEGVVLVVGGGAGAVGAAVGVEGGVVEEDGEGAGGAPVGGDGAVGVFFALRRWGRRGQWGLGRRGRGKGSG